MHANGASHRTSHDSIDPTASKDWYPWPEKQSLWAYIESRDPLGPNKDAWDLFRPRG